ncbi:hypothetical protein [Ornithinibacillus xuwenensis]|uniref:Uncharacterized protein n=1 Tax=Ornithinibacillus xuwenensis TaxID=3144668 RepID=A0ABU9XC85_9BACI
MSSNLIKRYIAYPMAIKVFHQDIERFKKVKLSNLYQDMLESIIERMQEDFYKLNDELRSRYRMDVKRLDNGRYKVNNEVLEYTPEELKEFTSQLMSEYLYGDKAAGFERKDRIWKD